MNSETPKRKLRGLAIDVDKGTMQEVEELMRLWDKFNPVVLDGYNSKKAWEHKLISCDVGDSTELAERMGIDGWEMCGFSYDQPNHRDHFWFKRFKTTQP